MGSSTCKTAGGTARQLLDAAWVKASTSKQVDNGAYGYGYLFWGGEQGTFRADGKYGQLSILCRDKDAVITVVGGVPGRRRFEPGHLRPALSPAVTLAFQEVRCDGRYV